MAKAEAQAMIVVPFFDPDRVIHSQPMSVYEREADQKNPELRSRP
jgi:hypothetical protein